MNKEARPLLRDRLLCFFALFLVIEWPNCIPKRTVLKVKLLIPLFIVAAFIGLAGCGFSVEERLTCKGILAEGEVGFSEVAVFMQRECGGCHTSKNPIYGHDFLTHEAAYKSSLHKADIIYTQMATGMMPPGGPKLEDEYLQRFRTWYCRGALYEDE